MGAIRRGFRDRGARGGGPRSRADRRGGRQPIGQDDGAGGPRDFDAGKKVMGRKRHLAVDTHGLPIACQITVASTQDRDALAPLLKVVRRKSPWVKMSFVDRVIKAMSLSARRSKPAASPLRSSSGPTKRSRDSSRCSSVGWSRKRSVGSARRDASQ